jgi:NADH-quinone oxidoreductase subunit G
MDWLREEGLNKRVDVRATFCHERCDRGPTVEIDGEVHERCTQEFLRETVTGKLKVTA